MRRAVPGPCVRDIAGRAGRRRGACERGTPTRGVPRALR